MTARLRLALPLLAVLVLAGCSSNDPTTCDAAGGVLTTDVTLGTGSAVAVDRSPVTVRYVGKLADGTVFDQSENASFTLDESVVPGFRLGITGMRIGGRRTIVIPPNLAYGARSVGPIPPCATLTFDVTLLDVR